jgi:hypothetical protein
MSTATLDQTRRRDLAMVERHVARGLEMIAEQRNRILLLEKHGRDLYLANDVLKRLLETQALHEQHRDRLRQELGLN